LGTIGRTYHVNLVRLYGFCFDATVKALVYEYMEKGTLDRYLFCRSGPLVLSRRKLLDIAVGTAKGIAYLHEECQQRIIHYDIKPANILLGGGFAPKVADFGLAKLCDRAATHVSMTGFRGTPGYTAPELFMPVTATHKCDVYSFGILLFEMVGRRRHFVEAVPESQLQWLPRWVWKRFEEGILEEALSQQLGAEEEEEGEGGNEKEQVVRMAKVALWCVQYLPADRPEVSKVVKMLEGEVEIATPPNPFRHLSSSEEIGPHGSDQFSETTGGDEITVCTASL
ncbi:hypothetical protein Taro_033500, partial [Colocasia esculenta]|nr:hypothetical protein [Colocasia esculenta]